MSSGAAQPCEAVQEQVIIWSVHIFVAPVSVESGIGTVRGVVVKVVRSNEASSSARVPLRPWSLDIVGADLEMFALIPALVRLETVSGVGLRSGVIGAGTILSVMPAPKMGKENWRWSSEE